MVHAKKKKPPKLHLTDADVDRALRNAEKFKRLVELGKTPEEIFYNLLDLVHVEKTPRDSDSSGE